MTAKKQPNNITPIIPAAELKQQAIKSAQKNADTVLDLAQSPSQELHLRTMLNLQNNYTIATGSAGSGRTYASVMAAAFLMREHIVNHTYIARPAVTAGENLGFLPGELEDKVDPFNAPIYDALSEQKLSKDSVEMLSVGHLRGRTLRDAAVIIDESQNVSVSQMHMIMTRLGEGSYMFINGDLTQNDLPMRRQPDGTYQQEVSGLEHLLDMFKHQYDMEINKPCHMARQGLIAHVNYDPTHTVRSEGVKQVVSLYDAERQSR